MLGLKAVAKSVRCFGLFWRLSHLPHLVWLDCTRVCYPLARFVWAGVNAALGCAPKEQFVGGENAIQYQSDPNAGRTAHFWTKPAAVVSCSGHFGMRVSGNNLATMATLRGQAHSCEEVQSPMELKSCLGNMFQDTSCKWTMWKLSRGMCHCILVRFINSSTDSEQSKQYVERVQNGWKMQQYFRSCLSLKRLRQHEILHVNVPYSEELLYFKGLKVCFSNSY